MANALGLESAVGAWVVAYPRVARVFEKLGIDYCCHGQVSLAEACRGRNLDGQRVLEDLSRAANSPAAAEEVRWDEASLTTLSEHIERTHHAYLRSELPRLEGLLAKVVGVHGAAHPELLETQRAFAALQADLVPHMFKEEQILFPAVRRLEQAVGPQAFPFGSVANPIRVMRHEHDEAGAALAAIRSSTRDFAAPSDACPTYRALLDGLRELELNMHQHVHKENNILFPRAIAAEENGGRIG